MALGHRAVRQWMVFLVAWSWIGSGCLAAQVSDQQPVKPKTSATAHTRKKRAVAHRSSGTTAKYRKRSPRHSTTSYRRRMARLHPEPQRIAEIQQALTQAGYLHQGPTGRWDEPTREAMLRFQQEHGFPTTGLPEAKSLMKLGLGPHPLPGDVALGLKAGTNADPPARPNSPTDLPAQPTDAASPSPRGTQ